MFRIFILAVMIGFSLAGLKGQNLIPDPGFENVHRLYDGGDTIYQYVHWKSLLGFKKLSPRGHPIFSIYEKRYKEDPYVDFWRPYEGDSYMYSHVVYFRNLYQTRLTEKMFSGNTYKVSFKYKIGADGFPKKKIEACIENKIGVLMTDKDMTDSAGIAIFQNHDIEIKPQLCISIFNADSIFLWQDFTGYIKAEKNYEYFIIGNFEPIIESHELRYEPITGAGYRIDFVTVEKIDGHHDLPVTIRPDSDNSFIQTNSHELTFEGQCQDSVLKYYQHVSQAESYILLEKYDSSAFEYAKAFCFKIPFYRDLRNANNVSKLLEKNGVPQGSIVWPSETPLLSSKLSKAIDSVFILDQLVRETHGHISLQDSLNADFVQSLLLQENISERSIGVNSHIRLNTLLLHLSRYSYFTDILFELHEAVLDGRFDNRSFATLVDSYYETIVSGDKMNSYYMSSSVYPLFTKLIVPKIEEDQERRVNTARNKIGLENLSIQYEKQAYNFKSGYQDFEFYQFFSMFPKKEDSLPSIHQYYIDKEKEIEKSLQSKFKSLLFYSKTD